MANRCTPASVPVNSLGRRGRRGNGSTLDRDKAACAVRWEGRGETELDESPAAVSSAHHWRVARSSTGRGHALPINHDGIWSLQRHISYCDRGRTGPKFFANHSTMAAAEDGGGRAGRTTCRSSYRYWASRSLQQASPQLDSVFPSTSSRWARRSLSRGSARSPAAWSSSALRLWWPSLAVWARRYARGLPFARPLVLSSRANSRRPRPVPAQPR
jgi:hypothetical protein